MTAIAHAKLLINGEWITRDECYKVHHPHTRELASTATLATEQDCNAAVQAASDALEGWESTPPSVRRALLLKAADLMSSEGYRKKFKEYTCKETGALEYWGEMNAVLGPIVLRETAALATHIKGETISSETPGCVFLVQRKAVGVVLAISPWNAPVNLTARSIGVPLICGNTVVLKSSEYSPYTQSLVVEAFQEAGLPKGVLNFLNMSRETSPALTAALIGHPAVRKINFTGSDRVGRIIAMEAAKYLKPCVLELGGKGCSVVLNDADVSQAAKAIVIGAMAHSGQVCMSTERVIVQRTIAPALISAMHTLVSSMTVSTSNSETANIGPVFAQSHAQGIVKMIKDAKDRGAEVLFGNMSVEGAVVGPHLVGDVKPGMSLWERESFGPVIAIAKADTVDDAIELANETDYSLTAALWTNSIEGVRIASRIRASTISLNGMTFMVEPSFGIFGLGGATGYGRFDIEHWTDKRAISIRPANEKYSLEAAVLGR